MKNKRLQKIAEDQREEQLGKEYEYDYAKMQATWGALELINIGKRFPPLEKMKHTIREANKYVDLCVKECNSIGIKTKVEPSVDTAPYCQRYIELSVSVEIMGRLIENEEHYIRKSQEFTKRHQEYHDLLNKKYDCDCGGYGPTDE
ncbi:MAG: hypothetical protein FWE47_01645 [Oscillospiraceae bacterium]|nr:hypothetical protein [Oscillospiraceae bacterium]